MNPMQEIGQAVRTLRKYGLGAGLQAEVKAMIADLADAAGISVCDDGANNDDGAGEEPSPAPTPKPARKRAAKKAPEPAPDTRAAQTSEQDELTSARDKGPGEEPSPGPGPKPAQVQPPKKAPEPVRSAGEPKQPAVTPGSGAPVPLANPAPVKTARIPEKEPEPKPVPRASTKQPDNEEATMPAEGQQVTAQAPEPAAAGRKDNGGVTPADVMSVVEAGETLTLDVIMQRLRSAGLTPETERTWRICLRLDEAGFLHWEDSQRFSCPVTPPPGANLDAVPVDGYAPAGDDDDLF